MRVRLGINTAEDHRSGSDLPGAARCDCDPVETEHPTPCPTTAAEDNVRVPRDPSRRGSPPPAPHRLLPALPA